ncbi:merozoite surface protein 3b [Pseudomonas aeruginosa]
MLTNYLQKSMDALRTIGITFNQEQAPVLALLDRIAVYDPVRIASIAETLTQATVFNAAVRDKIQGMDFSTRYADITANFDSIREDAQLMVGWMADGKLQFTERMSLLWMKLHRGSVPDRFERIRTDYLNVSKDALQQIETESLILNAYQDYRLAMKQSEVDAATVKKQAGEKLEELRQALINANAALEAADIEPVERVRLELARDEAQRSLQDEDKRYQVITDIADQLKTGYSAAELVFARLNQYHTVKQRLYDRSVSFFSTHEVVFTGLAASFTSAGGLSEATNTINAMTEGLSKGIEAQASTGGEQLTEALKAGYGSTIRSSSIKALADAVVAFQADSQNMINELRKEAAATSQEIESITEDSKRRYAALIEKAV